MEYDKKLCIFGGTGQIAQITIEKFLARGFKITSISLPTTSPIIKNENIKYIYKDINNIDDTTIINILIGCDYALLANGIDERIYPTYDPLTFYRKETIEVTKRLIRLCNLAEVKKVVILGSAYTYYNSIYPNLKLASTHPFVMNQVEKKDLALSYSCNAMPIINLEILMF
jgi:dihydroflavonol-4-reductase